jgi:hypothetical protein
MSPDELTRAVHDNLRNLGLDVLDVVNLRSMFDVHGPAEGCSKSRSLCSPNCNAKACCVTLE